MSAHSLVIKQWLKPVMVVMVLLAVGLVLSLLVTTLLTTGTRSAAVATEKENSIQRGIDADAARYTAMGAYYAAKEEASVQRGIDADAARYAAMGAYYVAKER